MKLEGTNIYPHPEMRGNVHNSEIIVPDVSGFADVVLGAFEDLQRRFRQRSIH